MYSFKEQADLIRSMLQENEELSMTPAERRSAVDES